MIAAQSPRVLVVEDEVIIAMTAEDMLEELGFVVAGTAASLAEAERAVAAGGFDVAMLDVNLNGQMSFPAGRMLAAQGVPFIFTTGYGASVPAAEFGDVEVVAKPYDCRDLGAALSRAVGR